jgi:hypothetical protein
MKKLVMLLSFALFVGIVAANAQGKVAVAKKDTTKTATAKPAAKVTAKPVKAAPAPAAVAAPKSATPINK